MSDSSDPVAPEATAAAPGEVTAEPEATASEPAEATAEPAVAGETSEPVQPDFVGAEPAGLPVAAASTPARRSRKATVAISLLSAALVLALGAGAWLTVQFVQAQQLISDQDERISYQEDMIDDQKKLIDEKESFGAAMNGLMDTASMFEGVPMGTIVPWDEYQSLAVQAWADRWDAKDVAADTEQVAAAAAELEEVWANAQKRAKSNKTGSTYESVIDELGGGFVASVIDDKRCGRNDDSVLGCVYGDEPYLVHFDASGNGKPFMTDELRTGIAYHEFAHVLQFTNPEATDTAVKAFGGDLEIMADCFALTYLPGWKLDHRIWVSSYEYWDVSIGYGHTCSGAQKKAIRDWHKKVGVELREIGPGAQA